MGKNKYYYGIPHCHTSYSTGRGTPLDAFEYGKENDLDFMVITDHNSFLDKNIPNEKKEISRWAFTKNIAEKFRKKNDDFLSLIGFETKTSPYGDFNIINPSTFFTGTVRNLNLLLLWMINNPDSFITINHPHRSITLLDYNEYLNKLITSIEVGNGTYPNKYIRYDKYFYTLLDKGWKLGAINGQDNHRMNFGDSENLTVIIAQELSKASLIKAFRERRTFSTESRSLKMFFKINDYFMGDEITKPLKKLRFIIFAEDLKRKIFSIEILSNGVKTIKKLSDINLNSIKYIYEQEVNEKENWYVIKINEEGNRIAISSPIFIKK